METAIYAERLNTGPLNPRNDTYRVMGLGFGTHIVSGIVVIAWCKQGYHVIRTK